METLFSLPSRLKDSRNLRQERETALRKEIERLKKQQEKEDKKIEDGSILSQVEKKENIAGEARRLLAEDEERVKEVLLVPQAFENLRKSGPERAKDALETELQKLITQQKQEEEKKKKENSASFTTAVQRSQKSHLPSKREIAGAPKDCYYIYESSCAWFSVLMALFPAFRLSIQDLIINPVIEYVTSAVLREASTVGEQFTERLPFTSKIIVSLYNIFGFWVFTAGVIWFYFQLGEIARFVGISTGTLIQNRKKSTK